MGREMERVSKRGGRLVRGQVRVQQERRYFRSRSLFRLTAPREIQNRLCARTSKEQHFFQISQSFPFTTFTTIIARAYNREGPHMA